MDDGTAMAAAVAQPRTPPPSTAAGSRRGFFSFLKDGVLVTTRNRGLFLRLAALHAARSLALLAARTVAVRYMGPTLGLKANGEDGYLPVFAILDKALDGHSWLLCATAAFLVVRVANVFLGLAIKAATAYAAVASCSKASSIDGGPGRTSTLTLASLFRRNLRGPIATAVFVEVVWRAVAGAWELVTLAVSAAVEAYASPCADACACAGRELAELVSFLLHLTAIPVVFIYCYVARDVAVVVSVAEPGLRAGGAFRRARRLTRGGKKLAQVSLHMMLSWALNKAVWRVHDVAMVAAATPLRLDSLVFWLDTVVLYMVVGAVKVLYTATVTAYYFDCKRTEEEKAAHVHMD